MTNAVNLASAAGTGFAFRNRIINGAMSIDQRNAGAAFIASTTFPYTVDRWIGTTVGSTATFQQVASSSGNGKALRVTGNTSNTTTQMSQRIEAVNISDLAGQTVTVSFTVYGSNSGSVSVRFLYPTATDNFGTTTEPVAGTAVAFTTTATRYTVTRTLDANANKGLWLVFEYGATASGITRTLEDVQLEVGSVATPFERRPYGLELALCQRYCQVQRATAYTKFGSGVASTTATTAWAITISPKVPMRATPTISQTNCGVTDTSSNYAVTSIGNNISSADSICFDITIGTSSLTAGRAVMFGDTGSANAVLTATAEL